MPKIVDKRIKAEAGEYAVAFAARDAQGSYEHAFVVWHYSDPAGHRTNRRAAGFYPAGSDMYDLIVGGTPGAVIDDSKEKIAKQIIVLVNSDVFQSSLEIEQQYGGATYRLATNDCVSFVAGVAEVIPSFSVPSRLLNVYPSTFIAAMHDSN